MISIDTQLMIHCALAMQVPTEAWDIVSLKDEAHDTGHLNDLDRHSAHEIQFLGQVLTEAWDKS